MTGSFGSPTSQGIVFFSLSFFSIAIPPCGYFLPGRPFYAGIPLQVPAVMLKYINGNKLISGATILGDGEVALILDVNPLM